MQPKTNILNIPGAIIVAGALVAVAIIWTQRAPTVTAPQAATLPTSKVDLAPVTAADHILGNPNAPIKIVEFSDPSCPYCKAFNPTMVQIMDEYGPSGNVAWVYRSFPLDKPDANGHILHPNAGHESQALECAASLGGNDKFWAYEKELYTVTPSVTAQTPNGLDQSQLPKIAQDVGLDPAAFSACLSSGKFKAKVDASYTQGLNAGVNGTPTSFIITPAGSDIALPGAQPYSTIKNMIDSLLTEAPSQQASAQ
ncbi:thioredoxin domain-containing protein [Patescibacteria group bacterium]|nr:thioredoxin domain-containing protein [Patescibacteria group bacterium]